MQKFYMKEIGQLSHFLGIHFDFENNTVKMHQSRYIKRLINRFNMTDCNQKPVTCHASTNSFQYQPKLLDDAKIYQEIVGISFML